MFEKCHGTVAYRRLETLKSRADYYALIEAHRPVDSHYKTLSCVSQVESNHHGREAEAYLNFIISQYDSLSADTFYVFMQGSGIAAECNRDFCMPDKLLRLAPDTRYRSFSSKVKYIEDDNPLAPYKMLEAIGVRDHQGMSHNFPMRATFAVSGHAIQQRPRWLWEWLLHYTRSPSTRTNVAVREFGMNVSEIDDNQAYFSPHLCPRQCFACQLPPRRLITLKRRWPTPYQRPPPRRAITIEHAWAILFKCFNRVKHRTLDQDSAWAYECRGESIRTYNGVPTKAGYVAYKAAKETAPTAGPEVRLGLDDVARAERKATLDVFRMSTHIDAWMDV